MEAYVFDAVRTARGKARKGGGLAEVKPVALAAACFEALETRLALDTALVNDALLGCVTATGEQGADIAKIAALYAGWADSVSGATVNRFCASGLSAIGQAALQVSAGVSEMVAAGGVESLSRVPMFSDGGAWFTDPEVAKKTRFVHMGISADLLATHADIGRGALDAYAVQSQQRAAAARDEGRFSGSIVPVAGLEHDETIRDDVSLAKVGALPPAFEAAGDKGGDAVALAAYPELDAIEHRHTAASSPTFADAAALALIGGLGAQAKLERAPRARIRAVAHASVEPVLMLTGNVDATRRALALAELSTKDVDVFEVNESFAAVPLHYALTFELDPADVNPNGGAIAMGHPLGATGGVLLCTLLDELERRDGTFGVASICGGAGVATAVVVERLP